MKELNEEQINEIEEFLNTANFQCLNRGYGFVVPYGYAYPYEGRPDGRLAVVAKEGRQSTALFEIYRDQQ